MTRVGHDRMGAANVRMEVNDVMTRNDRMAGNDRMESGAMGRE